MSYRERMTPELIKALNMQIGLELQASYVYLSMATHCAKSSVALPGFKAFFSKESEEERTHAQEVIDFMLTRGNEVELFPIQTNDQIMKNNWNSVKEMIQAALELEMNVCDSIHDLLDLADKSEDHHAEEWLEDFLDHQMKSIYNLEILYTQVKRVGEADGLYSLDLELLQK